MNNNFNQSSTGVSIEESIFYDNDMGSINFNYDKEEVIKALIHDTPDSIDKVVLRGELDKIIPTEPKGY